ncbi:MAG: alpha/beta hydrolase, partial [Symploca sp. SIO2B6]|nr:alpha/beta hydrolase [Symploca sp. SIO2B6]
RSRPIVLRDLIQGIKMTDVQCDRHSLPISNGTSLPLNLYHPPLKIQHPNSKIPNPNSKIPNPKPSSEATQSDILKPSHPTLITFYGGGWHNGHPDETADFSRYMAAQGYVVVAIAYRHAPDHLFPTQLNDVQMALRWIVEHHTEYNIDPSRVALVGWSAGAHLALLTAYQSHLWPSGLNIRAVANYYGPVDLAEGYRDLPHPDPIDGRAVLTDFLGGSPTEVPDRYREASPLYQIQAGLPSTLSIYGDRDHIVKPIFGQRLDQQLRQKGNHSILIRLPWAEHAFDKVSQGLGNQIALYYVERFFAWTLR